MSHAVNDEILENLYEEVKEEYPTAQEGWIEIETFRRFEAMSM